MKKSLALFALILALVFPVAVFAESISVGNMGAIKKMSLVYYDPSFVEEVPLSSVSAPRIDLLIAPDKNLLYLEVTLEATAADIWYGLPGMTRYRLPQGETKVLTLPPDATCTLFEGPSGREVISIRVRVDKAPPIAELPLENPPEGQPARIVGCPFFAPVYDEHTTASSVIGWARLGEIVYLRRWNVNETLCLLIYNRGTQAGWVEKHYIQVDESLRTP